MLVISDTRVLCHEQARVVDTAVKQRNFGFLQRTMANTGDTTQLSTVGVLGCYVCIYDNDILMQYELFLFAPFRYCCCLLLLAIAVVGGVAVVVGSGVIIVWSGNIFILIVVSLSFYPFAISHLRSSPCDHSHIHNKKRCDVACVLLYCYLMIIKRIMFWYVYHFRGNSRVGLIVGSFFGQIVGFN
eukprot:m.191234 g.191234  ORF g.191234 m.191234 type:complete len:186 (+) comp32422_c0_seq3:147-704(+)